MENNENQQLKNSSYFKRKLIMSYWTSTLCISLVLYMAGLFLMLLFNTQHITDMFRSNIKMTITLNDKRSLAETESFRKMLDGMDFVRQTKYISKDAAAEELKKELGEDFYEILDGKNPLFSQIEVKLSDEYSNMDSIKSIEKLLKKNVAVDEVYYPKDVWRNATTVISKVASIVLVLTLVLLAITVILINNTARLKLSGNRFDIHTAKLIGATNWKISQPYLKNALVQSVVAVFISVIGLTLTIRFLENILQGVFMISAFYPTLITMALAGIIITVFSTFMTVRKYLNTKEEDLYLY
ncbi:MAG: permease-like cell division protein FtsX [Bacteroidales bacterium]|nr:permease-like cell division protein FtsX [Bacteroidales bacterium]